MDPATIALIVNAAQELLPVVLTLIGALFGARGVAATVNEQVSDARLGRVAGVVKAVGGIRKKANE